VCIFKNAMFNPVVIEVVIWCERSIGAEKRVGLEDKEKFGRVVFVAVRGGKHLRDSLAGLHGVVRGEREDLEFPVCFEALDTWGGTHVCDCFRGAYEFKCPPNGC